MNHLISSYLGFHKNLCFILSSNSFLVMCSTISLYLLHICVVPCFLETIWIIIWGISASYHCQIIHKYHFTKNCVIWYIKFFRPFITFPSTSVFDLIRSLLLGFFSTISISFSYILSVYFKHLILVILFVSRLRISNISPELCFTYNQLWFLALLCHWSCISLFSLFLK